MGFIITLALLSAGVSQIFYGSKCKIVKTRLDLKKAIKLLQNEKLQKQSFRMCLIGSRILAINNFWYEIFIHNENATLG